MSRIAELTLADLVVLSMLTERPMHGYEMWQELERREVQEWASISRPQVYYSLRKLEHGGQIAPASPGEASGGPERRTFRPTAAGSRGLADALARETWATRQIPAPFLTWMVLSWQARPGDAAAQLDRRRDFVRDKLAFERAALKAIIAETSPDSDAAMVVRLTIRQHRVELAWLAEVAARSQRNG
ncbi:MAG: PadR family transcriptional regulator [Gemmatimonadales bacterium]